MGIRICTIAARNYLPFVRTLAASFSEVHPDGQVSALIFDDVEGVVGDGEAFEVVHLNDLPEELAELHRMATIYDIAEFATALKPWLLEYLLARGTGPVLYLDPDIQVFSTLQPLADAADAKGIALTPHVDTPMPLDGRKVDDRTILGSGIYNLGFVGVGPSAQPFLAFWKERLRRECTFDPVNMRFVDQRWVDFVPGLFDHEIVRDPRYNVAYWNLHGRTVRWNGSSYDVNGSPLAFFHFSGFSPSAPHLLSKHQGDRPRILLSEHPDLARLCNGYAAELMGNGYASDSTIEYGLATMADGTPIDAIVRRIYRAWLDDAESGDDRGAPLPPDPFDPDQVPQVIGRLNAPAHRPGQSAPLTAYLAALYGARSDLQREFPDVGGADHDRFMAWVADEACSGRIPPALAREPLNLHVPRDGTGNSSGSEPGTGNSSGSESDGIRPGRPEVAGPPSAGSLAGDWAPADRLRSGIVVAGFLNAELGLGQGARLLVEVVKASGVPFTTVGFRSTSNRLGQPFESTGSGALDYDTNIVAVNPDHLPYFAAEAGSGFFDGRYTIGQWAWELEAFPEEYRPLLEMVHEVWAISEFSRAAIAATTDKPVFAVPLPIATPDVGAGIDRATLGIPDGFMFLFCFDFFSSIERKNPTGLVDAFIRAFRPGEGPILVVKSINGSARIGELERLRHAAGGREDIVILDRYLDAAENAALMAQADCYASLHRSEGFGLTMAEAMALGKPVIATAYSANLEFMDDANSYLVPATMTTVPPGCDPYPAGGTWADPDLDEAARLMRHVAANPAEAAAVGVRARESVLAHHSVERRAEFVRRRFEEIQQQRAALIERGRSAAPIPLSAAERQHGNGGPPPDARTIAARARQALRSLRSQR